jgi:diaminohydroxyphosphoribosylaminopyrimidine deaminase / 5-amino-6-(5-phosphoribosylamino)uracil reductase
VTLASFCEILTRNYGKKSKQITLHFVDFYRAAVGLRGSKSFDYLQNDGRFDLFSDDSRELVFRTRWTTGGKRAIYAIDNDFHVASARYAATFDEIDDPGALDFSNYTHRVEEGEIAVFRNHIGFALIQVRKVLSGPRYGDDRTELQFDYELRLP